MNSEETIGIIELGNLDIKCLIFKIKPDNSAEILSSSIFPSEGIHNDIVINITKASNAIRKCISTTEKEAKISLKKINVIFEQPDFLSTKFSKHKKIDGSKIHKEDIEFLLKEAKKQLILNDRNQSIIHIFNHNYIVDGKKFIEEPIGVYADSLTHEITFITTPKNNLKNINQVFTNCDIEIERLVSRTFSLGVKSLNNDEFQSGSILIDIGFEKISLGVFSNFALAHSITFPFGLNHITKDLSKVCSLSLDECKNIRNDIDFSFENNQKLFDSNSYLKNTYFTDSKFRKISKNLIINVIKARLDEISELLKKQLTISGLSLSFGNNIVLAGDALNFFNIEKYLANSFKLQIRKIDDGNVENFEKNFSSCLGALKIIKEGWETEAIPEIGGKSIEKMGFFAKFFRIFK